MYMYSFLSGEYVAKQYSFFIVKLSPFAHVCKLFIEHSKKLSIWLHQLMEILRQVRTVLCLHEEYNPYLPPLQDF